MGDGGRAGAGYGRCQDQARSVQHSPPPNMCESVHSPPRTHSFPRWGVWLLDARTAYGVHLAKSRRRAHPDEGSMRMHGAPAPRGARFETLELASARMSKSKCDCNSSHLSHITKQWMWRI
eukprot:scaffold98767_cov32-Tisochrysis_lutea.AAC.10